MLTLPSDLTPQQVRALDAEIHRALHPGQPVIQNGDDPLYQVGPMALQRIPAYTIPGAANQELAEAMIRLQPPDARGQTERGALMIQTWGEGESEQTSVALTNLRRGKPLGIASTLALTIVACFCDWKGIQIPVPQS